METAVSPAEIETTETTYFEPARLLRICSSCEILSWFALALGIFTLLAGLWVLIVPLLGSSGIGFSAFMGNAGPLVVLFGLATLICFFFWIFLRAIAEALYLMMDIQDGLRGSSREAGED